MKRFLLMLILPLVLLSCSNDDSDTVNYLTGIDSVKEGISGLWEIYAEGYKYAEFQEGGKVVIKPHYSTSLATYEYDIVQHFDASTQSVKYAIRIYANDHLGEPDKTTYTDRELTMLTKEMCKYIKNGEELTVYRSHDDSLDNNGGNNNNNNVNTGGCGMYNGHYLYKGPKGGCYYYNKNGNKTYVDRSYCNC